jgi:hypothetical protein
MADPLENDCRGDSMLLAQGAAMTDLFARRAVDGRIIFSTAGHWAGVVYFGVKIRKGAVSPNDTH